MEHLNPDELGGPDEYVWIWDWFWELSSTRRYNQNGPDPIRYEDIEVWARMTGTILLMEEIDIIRQMDRAFMSALGEERENNRKREKAEQDVR